MVLDEIEAAAHASDLYDRPLEAPIESTTPETARSEERDLSWLNLMISFRSGWHSKDPKEQPGDLTQTVELEKPDATNKNLPSFLTQNIKWLKLKPYFATLKWKKNALIGKDKEVWRKYQEKIKYFDPT